MPPLKKARWERFALAYFEGESALEATKIAGYSVKGAAPQSYRLVKNAQIQARLRELQEAAATPKIMTVIERKERLSEIARGRYADFVTAGPDGSWIDIGPEKINSAAICEVKTRTEYDDDGDKPSVIMSVKLHDPIRAIAELNKMEGTHAPVKLEAQVNAEVAQVRDLSKVPDAEIDRAIAEVERILAGA